MSVALPTSTRTLGAVLERDRLERRVRRITVAIGVLRQRTSDRREPGARQRHLGQAIADFEAQIEALTTRLRDLGTDAPSNVGLAVPPQCCLEPDAFENTSAAAS